MSAKHLCICPLVGWSDTQTIDFFYDSTRRTYWPCSLGTILEFKMFPPINPVQLLTKHHTSVECKLIWPPFAGEVIRNASGGT